MRAFGVFDPERQPAGAYYLEPTPAPLDPGFSHDPPAAAPDKPTPKNWVNAREYFGRKLGEDAAKRTPAGGSWYPAKSDPVWHGSDRAGADPTTWWRGGAAELRPVRHEQSETKPVPGGYQQVYGRQTPRAGQPIPKRYPFEQAVYPNEQEAIGSAIVRSELEGRRLGAQALR